MRAIIAQPLISISQISIQALFIHVGHFTEYERQYDLYNDPQSAWRE